MTETGTARALRILVVCVALVGVVASGALAQGGDEPLARDPAVEQEIHERLEQVSPAAVLVFVEATEALDAGALGDAEAGFEQVLDLAPRFPDASRRLGRVKLARGKLAEARKHAFEAYGYDPAPSNLALVATVLVATGDGTRAGDALAYARGAADALPEDEDVLRTHLQAALDARDEGAVKAACEPFAEAARDDVYGHFCAGIALADNGQWNDGEAEILYAADLGMPAEEVEWALANDTSRRAWFERRARGSAWVMMAYALAPLCLMVAGLGLGRMTVAAARRAALRGDLRVSASERFLHAAYRVVILLTSIWYYASIPLLWFALVSAWIGIILLFYAEAPIWLRAVVTLALIATQYVLAFVYIGLTARIRHAGPGRSVDTGEAPRLWNMVTDLGHRLQTQPIDSIYAIPDARIAVQEEGTVWQLVRGKGQRSLVLGLGLLPGMTERQMRAVLVHEYAHFANRDTAGGQIARQVHASMQRMAVQLTMIGQNKWYNPGWWYVAGFTRIFLLVTMGASRLHEILADRTAARVCGAGDFTSALRHIVRQDHTFSAQVRAEMRQAKEQGRQVGNLYALPPVEAGAPNDELKARIASAIDRPTSRFDTHLSTRDRIGLLGQLPESTTTKSHSAPAWGLFLDPDSLQLEMTEVIRATVRRREDRLLRAVAEAHDEETGRLRRYLRRATWFWRSTDWPWSQGS